MAGDPISGGELRSALKIAVIGNMNNAGFCIMRFLRDLGHDADLILYSNDGVGPHSHFSLESDCWDIDNWRGFVKQSSISDTMVSALDGPWSWLFALRSLARWLRRKQDQHYAPVSAAYAKDLLSGYDILIGSGVAPAICARAGLRLDIFWPYAMGVEYLETPPFLEKFMRRGRIARWFATRAATWQAQGIRAARHIFNSDLDMTADALARIGAIASNVPIPAIYNGAPKAQPKPSGAVASILAELEDCDFSVMMHARLAWIKPATMPDAQWEGWSKNNDWAIDAFAALVKRSSALKCRLILFEYGSDVEATKQYCSKLEVAEHVIWAPTMRRRDIMSILPKVTIGVGEFYVNMRVLWGSTGWEVLAAGKPLLQGFMFNDGEFERAFGFPPPPMLAVQKKDDVLTHMEALICDPERGERLGDDAAAWFNRHNGIGLARRWIDIARNSAKHFTHDA